MYILSETNHSTPKSISISLGMLIRKYRLIAGKTGQTLGQELGISQQQVSRYERGINNIDIVMLVKIINLLNIDHYLVLKIIKDESINFIRGNK